MANKLHFQQVGRLRPRRSVFDLSHDHKTTLKMGQLVPVLCMECVPGDIMLMHNEIVLRFQPMIAPVLHQVDVYTHTFFVPYRLLWGGPDSLEQYPSETARAWEYFISGGPKNDFAQPLPRWIPSSQLMANSKGTLWDYLGFSRVTSSYGITVAHTRDQFWPVDWPRRAYNWIYNEYYRDQDLEDKVSWSNESILYRKWEKDYFTIARPYRQRGQAMAVPLIGNARVQWGAPFTTPDPSTFANVLAQKVPGQQAFSSVYTTSNVTSNTSGALFANMQDGVGTFDLADIRQIAQLTKWQERNQRAGVRYKEFIPAHFGVDIGDSRIDRPEYIGGTRSPVIISEVLQTEGTTQVSPQANMAGHGITADTTRIGRYNVKEYGLIMTILSVRPRTSYAPKGINRQWLRRTRYDHYFPEFAHLSEQGIYKGELHVTSSNDNQWSLWGYIGIYDELRYIPSLVTGDMMNVLKYWHLSRYAATTTATTTTATPLNKDFVTCIPRDDIFSVLTAPDPTTGTMVPVDNLILNYASRIKAVRPLPFIAEPGLIDHF